MPRCATSIKFRAAERRILQHPPDGSESADFAHYRAFSCLSRRFSHEIRWNPESQEWFCARCGRTSDHLIKEDAQARDRRVPLRNVSARDPVLQARAPVIK